MSEDFSFSFDIPDNAPKATSGTTQGSSNLDPFDTSSGAILSERKARRGRPKKSGIGAGTDGEGLSAEDKAAMAALFQPEQWEALVSAPANGAALITGSDAWNLSEKETKQLAIGAATTARYFAPSHPKWLALSLFSMSVITIYGAHFVKYRMEVQSKKAGSRNLAPVTSINQTQNDSQA
jgi:hypothetical protein